MEGLFPAWGTDVMAPGQEPSHLEDCVTAQSALQAARIHNRGGGGVLLLEQDLRLFQQTAIQRTSLYVLY